MLLAGSAIKQGPYVGRVDQWSQWNPTTTEQRWLLLCGATDPPGDVHISDRRTRDAPGDRSGAFLAGITRDLVNMEDAVGAKLFNTVKDLYLTKDGALGRIKKFFKVCEEGEFHPMLYYTGHGEIGTGNWCFSDGTIGIQELIDLMPDGTYYPMIFSDACFSGHWANFCLDKNIPGFHCLAACPEYTTALDTKGQGGDLTLFMTGKKFPPRTAPIYSGGNRVDYPISSDFINPNYTDFLSGNMEKTEKILITQTMLNGYFTGCFATSKLYNPRPATLWWSRPNHDTFLEFVKKEWEWSNGNSKQIYSLACDEKLGFGIFLMENFGTLQTIVYSTSDIEKKFDDSYLITACAARGSSFYIIMTKGTKEYTGKGQEYFTHSEWKEIRSEINRAYKKGKVITGICYSTGLGQYFVVMTEMAEGQCCKWFENTDNGHGALDKWVTEKWNEGFHPTIFFHDPTHYKILCVMTKDKNRSDYQNRIDTKLE